MVLPPLKCICMPCLLQMLLQLSLSPLVYGTTVCVLVSILCWVVPGVVVTLGCEINVLVAFYFHPV